MKGSCLWWIVVCCWLFVTVFKVAPCLAADNDEVFGMGKLMKTIMSNYNKEILPSKPVIVSLSVLLLKVKTTVEREGIFESVIALFLEWLDPRVVWNPAEYNNVSELTFDSEKVWLPDIAMTNSADHMYSISKDTKFVIRVTHKGVFNFVPTGTAKTWCDLKLLTFPFDIQTCSIEFESWSLNTYSLKINESATVIIDPSFSSLQFSLCGYKSKVYEYYYELTDEYFSRLQFDFIVRRKSSFYVINLIFPIATLSLIEQLVFFIPIKDSSSDRIGFGTTNMLTLVVFQTIVTEEMPKTSDAVTALSKYIIVLIILSGMGILESVIVERMTRMSSKPPPTWLYLFMEKICPFKFERFYRTDKPMDADDLNEFEEELLASRLQTPLPRRGAHVDFGETENSRARLHFKFMEHLCCNVDECVPMLRSRHNLHIPRTSQDRNQQQPSIRIHRLSTATVLPAPEPVRLTNDNSSTQQQQQQQQQQVQQQQVPGFVSSQWQHGGDLRRSRSNPPSPSPTKPKLDPSLEPSRQPEAVSRKASSNASNNNIKRHHEDFFQPIVLSNETIDQERSQENGLNSSPAHLAENGLDLDNNNNNNRMRPTSRRGDLTRSSMATRNYRRKNMEQWEDVAARIDIVAFFVCTGLSLLLPILLFLPLTLFDSTCPSVEGD